MVTRNSPCPCGSGKKYKHCCLPRPPETPVPIMLKRVREAEQRSVGLLFRFARREFGAEAAAEAWQTFKECCGGDLLGDDPWSAHASIFATWWLYAWYPGRERHEAGRGPYPRDDTIAARFLASHGSTLQPLTRDYIDAARHEPHMLWEVIDVRRGEGLQLRDLALGRERWVHDRSASEHAARWDILLAHIVGLDDTYICSGLAPYPLPPAARDFAISELKRFIRRPPPNDPAALLRRDLDVISTYGEALGVLARRVAERPSPVLRNTDNQELVWTRLEYAFKPSDRDRIITALASMPEMEGPDPEGQETTFSWVVWRPGDPQMPNVCKGTIYVGASAMRAEANSRERGAELGARIAAGLGSLVTLVNTEHQPMAAHTMPAAASGAEAKSEALDLDDLPEEVREELIGRVQSEMLLGWADRAIPALGGKTPREAVQTEVGRTRVAEMLREWENMSTRHGGLMGELDFDALRRELGLTED